MSLEKWQQGRSALQAALNGALDDIERDLRQDIDEERRQRQQAERKLSIQQTTLDAQIARIERLQQDNEKLQLELKLSQSLCNIQRDAIENHKTSLGAVPASDGPETDGDEKSDRSTPAGSFRISASLSPFAPLPSSHLDERPCSSRKRQADSFVPIDIAASEHEKGDTQYHDLLEKYIKLKQNWVDIKNANQTLRTSGKKRHDQLNGWKRHVEYLEEKITALEATLASYSLLEQDGGNVENTVSNPPPTNMPQADEFVASDGRLPDLPTFEVLQHPLGVCQMQPRLANAESMTESTPSQQTEETQDASSQVLKVLVRPDEVVIKLEKDDDTPVVVSSRAVKKPRVLRESNGAANRSPAKANPKIKTEKLSSSPVKIGSLHDADASDSLDLDRIGDKIVTPKKRRYDQTEDRDLTPKPWPLLQRKPLDPGQSATSEDIASRRTALQPKNPNKRVLQTSTEGLIKKRRRDNTRFSELLEDGEDMQNPLVDKNVEKTTPRATDNRLLERLLEHQPEPKQELRSGVMTPRRETSSHGVTSFSTPKQCPQDVARKVAVDPASASSMRSKASTKRNTPLRSLPVKQLSLSDFRINPNANHGYNYAFSEVVHKKADRKCMPGCIRPECCGTTFRRVAEFTLATRPTTDSQGEHDERLLEQFLGDRKELIESMTKEERDELILQAHTKNIADTHGRHKHTFERRPSPPGFWRADFPDTQELEADRREAARVEDEMVQRRYEEAMRPGGLWMFRDE